MNLVAGAHEVVDGGDAIGDGGGPHIDDLGHLIRHQRKTDARPPLRIVVEEIAVDIFGRERALGVGQIAERRNKVANVIANGRIDAEVAILADVVDPGCVVDLVRSRQPTLPRRVALQGGAGLLDVDEDRDGVGKAFPARHVAVGARHRTAVRDGRCDEMRRAPVRSECQRLLDSQHQVVALNAQPVVGVALVAVQRRDLPVRGDFDALDVRVAREDFASPLELRDRRLEIDLLDINQVARKRHRARCSQQAANVRLSACLPAKSPHK